MVSDHQYSYWQKEDMSPDVFVFNKVMSLLPNNETISILDVGCGNGYLHDILKQKGYVDVTGIDYSIKLIDEARKKNPEYQYHVKDACIDFKFDRTFDVVLCCDLLEHVYAPFYLIKNLVKYSNRDIIISTPNALRVEIDGYMKYHKNEAMNESAYQYLTPHVIKRMFIRCGAYQTYVDWRCKIGIGHIFMSFRRNENEKLC